MAKDVIITPLDGDIQFKNSSGNDSGKIEQSGNDLVLTNAVGDVLIGDGASDVFVGDGSNSVDIIFEQPGSIKGLDGSSVNLTIGSYDTDLVISGSTLNLQPAGNSTTIGGPLVVTKVSSDQNTSQDSGTVPATTIAETIKIHGGSYTNGQYTTEIVKVDRSGNLPLYVRQSKGTANAFTNLIRIGDHGQTNGTDIFAVFGKARVDGIFTVTGGSIVLGGTGRIQGIDTVSSGTDAANKNYVDNKVTGLTEYVAVAGDTMTGTLTSTQNVGDASIYINSTRPTLGFTDSNSFTDANDIYIIRGTSGNKLQFQWYDDSAGTTTETFNIDSSGTAEFAGDLTVKDNIKATGNNMKLHAGGTHVINIDLNKNFYPQTHNDTDIGFSDSLAFRNAYFSGTGKFSNVNASSYQLNGTYIVDSSRNLVNINNITISGVITADGITSGTTAANRTFQVSTAVSGALHVKAADGGTSGNAHTAPLVTVTGNGSTVQGGIYVSQNSSTGTSLGFFTTDSYAAGPKLGLSILDTGAVHVNRGNLVLEGTGRIQGIDTVSSGTDAANKNYVDNTVGSYLPLGGGIMTGPIDSHRNDTQVILKSGNSSASNADQFFLKHNFANVDIGNERGDINFTSGSVVFTNNIHVGEYIYHKGDTNTFIRLLGDEMRIVAGGRNIIKMDEGTDPDKVVLGDSATETYTEGRMGIGTSDPADNAKLTVMNTLTMGLPGAGSTNTARFLSIEGNADASGEGSGRIFFTEHNSTTTSMSNYGMSIGYRGGSTSIVGSDGNTWTGLSAISNGQWGMWGHDNSAAGNLIMYGDRAATYVDFAGNNIQGITDIYVDDQIISTGDTNTYMQFHAADQWRVVTGGGERIEANNTEVRLANNLVIGGTELDLPSGGMIDWANGDARIIEGLVNNYSLSFQTYDGSTCSTALRLDGDNSALFSGSVTIDASGSTVLDIQGSQGQLFSVTDDLSGDLFTVADISGVPILTVNASATSSFDGKVGIGTTTPHELLHVKNSSSGDATIKLETVSGGDPTLLFNSAAANRSGLIRYQDNGTNIGRIEYVHNGDRLAFQAGSASGETLSVINGAVGIGTTTPASLLHVLGSPTATNGALITARNHDATPSNTSFGGIFFNSQPGTDYSIGKSNVNASTTLSFRNGNTGQAYMDIDSSGRVGIGTTTPSVPLEVAGSDNTLLYLSSSTANVYLRLDDNTSTNGNFIGATGNEMHFWTNNTKAATIDGNGNLMLQGDDVLGTTGEVLYLYAGGTSGAGLEINEPGNSIYLKSIDGLYPESDNTSEVGNSSYTFADGRFTNFHVDNVLNVRNYIDLADSDGIRFGSGDDFRMFYDGSNNELEMEMEGACNRIRVTDNTTTRFSLEKGGTFRATAGFTTDGNAKSYTWRAIENTASTSNQYYRIARISGGQSTRFSIELVGRSTSYGDGVFTAWGKLIGQLNNDNNYDLTYYDFKTEDSQVVTEIAQVDVSTSATDIYIRIGQFSEIAAFGLISDGSITPYDTDSGSTSAPTGYTQAARSYTMHHNKIGNIDGTNFRDSDNTSYSLTPSSGGTGYWQVNTPSGYIQLGAQNSSWAHFQTDRSGMYFNKKVIVDTGTIGSYDEDLSLVRANSSADRILIRAASIGFFLDSAEDMRLENDGDLHVERDVIAYSSTISDERLKDNVITIGGALDKVKKLRGVEYTWNKGGRKDQKDIGVIAQEVEQVVPEIVREKKMPLMDDSDTKYKTVDYEKLTALLIEGMKEQQQQIDDLKAIVNKLQNEK